MMKTTQIFRPVNANLNDKCQTLTDRTRKKNDSLEMNPKFKFKVETNSNKRWKCIAFTLSWTMTVL